MTANFQSKQTDDVQHPAALFAVRIGADVANAAATLAVKSARSVRLARISLARVNARAMREAMASKMATWNATRANELLAVIVTALGYALLFQVTTAMGVPTKLANLLGTPSHAYQDALSVPAEESWPLNLPVVHDDLQGLIADVMPDVTDKLVGEERCLAQAVYFEARSEAFEGQLAVAQVVLNRVRDKRYPSSVCGVVFQGEKRKHKCQFSFACDGLSDSPREQRAWSTAKAISHIALMDYWDDVTGEATHYHAEYVAPYWSVHLDKQVSVGRHIFYRDSTFQGQFTQ